MSVVIDLKIERQTPSGIHYDVSGRNHAPALVLLHPLGANRGTWQPQLAEFERFFRVIRIDMRGHGQSKQSEGPPQPRRIEDLATDALEVLDALGIERAHWCGVSIGGAIALQVAVMAPRRVIRLVLANTAASFPPPNQWDERIATVQSTGLAPLLSGIPERWFTAGYREREPEEVARIVELTRETEPRGYIEACMVLRDLDLRGRLSEVQSPTLIVGATQDLSTPVERSEELMEGISGADLVVLDAAHLSNVEQAADFTAVVLDFLRD